jgi:hypothetical protein
METDMRTTLLAAAALALSGSIADAAMLLGSNENDHKLVIDTDARSEQGGTYTASVAEPSSRPVGRAFLIDSGENGRMRVIDQYAAGGEATYSSSFEAPAPAPQAAGRGFLLGSDENDGKVWINQMVR